MSLVARLGSPYEPVNCPGSGLLRSSCRTCSIFDGTAFSDNPKWSSCCCQWFYEDHRVVGAHGFDFGLVRVQLKIPPHIAHFWQSFVQSYAEDSTSRFFEAFHFDATEGEGDGIAGVLAGSAPGVLRKRVLPDRAHAGA